MIVEKANHPKLSSVLADLVISHGGLNPLGEPMYRMVWGEARLSWMSGFFVDTDEHGNFLRRVADRRLEPKYPKRDRWHLEVWLSAEKYCGCSPEEFALRTSQYEAGHAIEPFPYPSRGEYESIKACEDLEGNKMEPSASWITHAIDLHKARLLLSRAERQAENEAIAQRTRRDIDNQKDAILDDVSRAFGGVPNTLHANQPQKGTTCPSPS